MPIRIALVGAGHMGKIHLEKLASMDNVQVTGVADVDLKKATELAQPYGVPSFPDYKQLLGTTDGVIIATPTETHFHIARDFLDANVHVLIEKPLTSRQEEAKAIIDLGKQKRLIVQVGFLERFNPAFLKSLAMIRKPLLIESRRASTFTGRSTDIDVVLDLMIHDIDLILSLVKDEVLEVRAEGVSFVMDNLDMARARVEFAHGCIATLTANRISPRKERTLAIFEKNRSLFVDLLNRKVILTEKNNGGGIVAEEHGVDQTDAVRHEVAGFIHSIVEGIAPAVTGEDGLKALILADHIKRYIAESNRS